MCITIEITYKIEMPGRGSSMTVAKINSYQNEIASESVGDEGLPTTDKIGPPDRPIIGNANLFTRKRIYTWKRIENVTLVAARKKEMIKKSVIELGPCQ